MNSKKSRAAKILVVEDDESMRVALLDNLTDEGHTVDALSTGKAMMEAVAKKRYDVILLDIMLPDADGYNLCQKLRAEKIDSMVLMLTARTLEDDLVKGFEAGADDYLSKPYRLRELLMRINALLRRKESAIVDSQGFAEFVIDKNSRTVVNKNGDPIDLTRTEFDLLSYFLERRNQALTRDDILNGVWGIDVVVDYRTVDNFVSSLKRKLNWSDKSRFQILTIRGVGYRFELGE